MIFFQRIPFLPKIAFGEKDNPSKVNDNLADYVLYGIFSPTILDTIENHTESLPWYITRSIPLEINTLLSQGLSTQDKQQRIDAFYLSRAKSILKGYQSCPVPMPDKGDTKKETYNLLSPKGMELLEQLKKVKKPSTKDIECAFYASNKFLLDLDLFINIKSIPDDFFNRYKYINFSVTSGCYNNCAHCGYGATPPVTHMPYPLVLKFYHLAYIKEKKPTPFANSDPLSYRDKIIGADAGDLWKKIDLDFYEKCNISIPLIFKTKGILTSAQKIAFAKIAETCTIKLSYIDLPGENMQLNQRCIQKSINIFNSVPIDRRASPFFSVADFSIHPEKRPPKFLPCSTEMYFPSMVGNWVATCKKNNIPQDDFPPNKFGRDKHTVITSNGNIYEVELNEKTRQFEWSLVDSILPHLVVANHPKGNIPIKHDTHSR